MASKILQAWYSGRVMCTMEPRYDPYYWTFYNIMSGQRPIGYVDTVGVRYCINEGAAEYQFNTVISTVDLSHLWVSLYIRFGGGLSQIMVYRVPPHTMLGCTTGWAEGQSNNGGVAFARSGRHKVPALSGPNKNLIGITPSTILEHLDVCNRRLFFAAAERFSAI